MSTTLPPRPVAFVLLVAGLWCAARAAPAQQPEPREATPAPSPSPSPYRHAETILVQAIRADAQAPIAKTDIGREEIEQLDHGQELPFLLQQTPALTFYSDSGIGAGYSYLSIRGIQQTRINMTLDGAPLGEPEDSALYFADFGGFAGALESIQVQRGVGTSTVGTASFGGSINFASVDPLPGVALAGELGAGSFGARRGALDLHSGPLAPGLALYARVAYQESDGFREHSGTRQRTLFFGATRQDARSLFKLSGFSGRERAQLAFLASEQDVLRRNLRDNPLDPAEHDRFGQDFVQAQYTRSLGAASSLALQAYYNGAGGWYRLWDDPPIRSTLQQYALDWRLVGALLTLGHARGPLSLSLSVHGNDFESEHARDVVGGTRAYQNRGFKSEANVFAKLVYDPGRVRFYADAQVRQARFRYEGRLDLGTVDWTFFNPKLGVRYAVSPRVGLYASLGRATREPARMDMLSGEDDATLPYDLRGVRPERLLDLEAGVEYRSPGVRAQANLYAMEFRDEIALAGELSEIGLPLRRNVDRSRRHGFELELSARIAPPLTLRGSAHLSRSRIREWLQFYDVYDAAGMYLESVATRHRDVPPLLTPAATANLALEWAGGAGTRLTLAARHVSRARLDNTGEHGLLTPAYTSLDASAALGLARWLRAGKPVLRIQLGNLLNNKRIWPSGYSYLFFVRDGQGHESLSGVPYYYPLATRGVVVSLDFRL